MGKIESTPKKELKKGPWTREEDQKLLSYIEQHGHGSWRSLPPKAGLERCGKSCRLRWTNYLRPDIKRGKFSTHEEKTIIRLHALLGNRWSAIAAHLPKRTDNEIKNYWNTRLKKRLTRMGIDPTTHKPKSNGSADQSRHSAELSHMAQWETARLEAEARLARTSKLHLLHKFTPVGPPTPPCLPRLPCLDVLRAWQQASSGSLDSPTSTLNFSSGAVGRSLVVVPSAIDDKYRYAGASCGVGQGMMNHNEGAGEGRGKMGNSSQVLHNGNLAFHMERENDYGVTGAMDLAAADYYSEDYSVPGGDIVGEFEDVKDYWNELLNMVSSPMVPGL